MPDQAAVPDAVVVGSGPAGAVAAKRLAEAGCSVVCLEQGPWPDRSLIRADYDDFELRMSRDWNFVPNTRQAEGDYPIEESESDITPLMWNGVGGSSVLWAACWHRNRPSDFRTRTLDGVGDDWPMTYEDLVPYFEHVEKDFAISGLDGDPGYPGHLAWPLPAAPIGRGGRRIADAHNRLGWHWWPGSSSIATRAYGNLGECQQRAVCMWGCPHNAKGSTDLTHWPQLLQMGVKLVTRARVTCVETNGKGLATGVTYVDEHGREQRQPAKVVVLAANAIGTPRILLASEGNGDGVANSSGLVGRRLMMHPTAAVVGLYGEDLETSHGVWGQLAYCMEFYETDESRGFARGAKWSLQPTGAPMQATRVWPWGYEGTWGERFAQEIRRRFSHSLSWGIIAEDLPEAENRVELDPVLKDNLGMPAARVHYRTSENSRRMLQFMTERARDSHEAAGAVSTIVAPQVRETGWHLLGTTVMGRDPATSVVDEFGRAHDVPNLYVVDGSVWPTSSGLNPTATIAALALYFADHLVKRGSLQEVPA